MLLRSLLLSGFLAAFAPYARAQILQSEPEKKDTVPTQPVSPLFRAGKYLVLDKPGKVKRVRYFVGSEITFRLKGDPVLYRDVIAAVDDSSFTIFGTQVLIKEVDRVILRSHSWFANQGSVLLPAAGVIYFLADNLNPVIQGGEKLRISRGSVIVSAGLVGAGLVLRLLHKKEHRIGKNKRLRVLETF
jgi:hypothetical protein